MILNRGSASAQLLRCPFLRHAPETEVRISRTVDRARRVAKRDGNTASLLRYSWRTAQKESLQCGRVYSNSNTRPAAETKLERDGAAWESASLSESER